MALYETRDIFKGAFLLCKGGLLSGISFDERRIATFVISGEGMHRLGQEYMNGNALVNPVLLRNSLNHLRDLLFDMRDRRRRDDSRTSADRRHQGRR